MVDPAMTTRKVIDAAREPVEKGLARIVHAISR